MHPVEGMTKQGVRNLNNLGPKRKRVDPDELAAELAATEPDGKPTKSAAPSTDAETKPAAKTNEGE